MNEKRNLSESRLIIKKFTATEAFVSDLVLSIEIPELGQDVVIEAKNHQKLYGYSSILSSRSPTFAAFQSNHLQLEYDYKVAKEALKYIYTSNCDIPVIDSNQKEKTPFDLTCDLFSLAKDWNLYEVKFWCEQYILSEIEKTKRDSNDKSSEIKNQALRKLDSIVKLNQENLLEKVLSVIDKQIGDIIRNEDYLHISDSNLKMILARDTLNISRELSLFWMIVSYAKENFQDPKPNQNGNSFNERIKEILKQDLAHFIRFGTMDSDDFLEVQNFELLTDDEIDDISDFIEYSSENLDEKTKEIIEKYKAKANENENNENQKEKEKNKEKEKEFVHWFKSKRVYIDPNLINSSGIESEKNAKEIKPKNLAKTEGIVDKYSAIVQGWIWKNTFQKMKLQFISTKEDQLTCQDFHQVCDNQNPILVLIQSGGNIFGGYSSVGWKKPEKKKETNEFDINNYFNQVNYIEDNQAFLFILKSSQKDQQIKIELKEKQKKTAIVYYSQRGPIFGDGWDLSISEDLKTGYSNPGCSYQLPNNIQFGSKEAKMFFTQQYGEWKVDQLEVYF
ncbi:pep-cterm sorting domain-containing protein [Anaeramoeba ignava]|uniref:Pep-cterm sorting domain-containing protein n=1 Tax=Anaeramoeba ignava TaxID=1746090 RepID=A0A9Q0R9A4_ANAIG|nr:pep-cterm sorting domain-containing protein [Anaeramoeba ignava]